MSVSAPKGPTVPVATAPVAEPPKPKEPTTLGEYLEKEKLKPEDLKGQSWKMDSAARALLKAKGVESPTQSQLTETVFQLNEALAGSKWKEFAAPVSGPTIIKAEDGVAERLGNIFGEKKIFSESELTPSALKLDTYAQQKLAGDYESGRRGMILAASFINTPQRAEGDFTRAYGDVAWRGFVRASTHLDSIPKGKLLETLSVDTLIEVNRLVHAPDEGIKASILRGIAFIGRGFRWDKGGELREGRQFGRPETFTNDEVKNLQANGITFRELPLSKNDARWGQLEYPPASEVKPRLTKIIAELKTDMAAPNADPVMAAARFEQKFIALHPFGDSNGRTGRLVMNRILAEFDMAPAILKNQDKDVVLSPEAWRREVAEGSARSKAFINNSTAIKAGTDGYMGTAGIKALEKSPDKPVTLNGSPFDLGVDGFLYDLSGRPSLVMDNKVVPFGQLEYFTLSRRIMSMPKDAGTELLKKLTAETVALHTKVAADPKAGEKIVVVPDNEQRKADAEYRLAPHPEVAKLLVELANVDKMDPARMLTVSSPRGTATTGAISKYAQHDLELWYLQRGLSDGGNSGLADQVGKEREKLFKIAKEKVAGFKDAARVTPENPQGFKFKYEQMMFNSSPLRFGSLKEAVAAEGDSKVTVWRGDYSFAKLIGMAPNNDVRQKDAKSVAGDRFQNGAVALLYDELMKLEGSAVGRQYICTTSDLGLLAGSFADSKKSQPVNLASLPTFVADQIMAWAADIPEPKPGEKPPEVPTYGEKKDFKEIKDKFGVPGTLLKVRIADKATKKVEVEATRKAFELRLDKDALLPGIVALGFHSFESEQEMHGLERVLPWNIKSAHTADSLKEEFKAAEPPKPAADPAAATTTPAATPATPPATPTP